MRTIYILFIYLFISCSDKTHIADRCIKNQIFSENYDSISVDIRYIGYACSECPQYNIEKVYYSENWAYPNVQWREVGVRFCAKTFLT